MNTNYTDDLRLAHIMADTVDRLTLTKFNAHDFTVETKPDLTPVTDADREAEQLIRSQLSRVRTRDSVLGEEFGSTGTSPASGLSTPLTEPKTLYAASPSGLPSLLCWNTVNRW